MKLKPSLIVMDLALPIMDGWEATRRLKANPVTRDIPVVAVSGHAFKNEEHGARAAGCDAFVIKPCTPSELLEVISHHISGTEPNEPASKGRRSRTTRKVAGPRR